MSIRIESVPTKLLSQMKMCADTVVVETKNGPVRGEKRTSFMGDQFYGFQGIPYAKPPVGELRFRDPQPPKSWTKVYDATKQSEPSFGYNKVLQKVVGSEDCLHLNVFTKVLIPKTPQAVMVYIHGGAFTEGSSTEERYGPDYLLQKNVVVVTLNYRLGALGFLSVDEPALKIPGNAGLKDQALALKWVKDNISRFGGDAMNITVFGQSAGGASVHFHLLSDVSKEVFQKAIIMSGTALNYWAINSAKNITERLAKMLGWDENGGVNGAIEFLQQASAPRIVAAQQDLENEEKFLTGKSPFTPRIEPYISEQCIIPKSPHEMYQNAWSKDVPIMIGGTSEEGLLSTGIVKEQPNFFEVLGTFERFVPKELGIEKGSEKSLEIAKSIKTLYFGESEPTLEQLDNFTNFLTDKIVWFGLHQSVKSRLSSASAPTYLYRFNFDGEFNNTKYHFSIGSRNVRGACHSDDLCYIFKNMYVDKIIFDSREHKTIQRLIALWTSFAITGNPNNKELNQITWKPLNATETPFPCLNISDDLNIIDLPETHRLAVWEDFYKTQ